jgi:hypothetical protein
MNPAMCVCEAEAEWVLVIHSDADPAGLDPNQNGDRESAMGTYRDYEWICAPLQCAAFVQRAGQLAKPRPLGRGGQAGREPAKQSARAHAGVSVEEA